MKAPAKLVLPLLLCCCTPPLSLAPPPRAPAATDYPRIYDRWTRHGRVFSIKELDTVLLVHATLRSEEFERAYIARYLDAYRVNVPAERAQFQQQELAGIKDGLSFLVQTAGHSYFWGDLSKPKSLWRVALVDDAGRETEASAIELVRNRQVVEVELFGTLLGPPFSRSFYVRFPALGSDGQPLIRPETRALTLRIAGPQGSTDLSWKLQ